MRKLYVKSELPVDAATAWDLFESDDFRKRLSEQTGLESEVLETSESGGVETRRLRFTSRNELPAIASKALKMKNLTYVQTNRFDKGASRLDWVVELPVLTDRVSVSGATTITDRDGGSTRVVDGDIEVRLKLIGGQVEKIVVAEFEKSMTRAVDLVREMIRERNLA